MATLTHDEIADLVAGTLMELGPPRFQQIAQELTEYEVMGQWLKKDRVVFDEGRGIQRNLMTKLGGAASHAGLFEEDQVNVPDLMTQLSIPWRHAKTHWAFERREPLMNRGRSLVFNVIKPRRTGAMIDMAAELEDKAWGDAPAVGNETDPYSIAYYVVKNATAGFNGGNPGSHTACAGVNSDTSSGWKNYTFSYAATGGISKGDAVKKMRTAHRKTNWKSPVDIQDYRKGKGRRYRLYVNETTISTMEDIGEKQNENLGRDLAPYDGSMTFRKHPVRYIPKLDDETDNPIYMIDHSCWFPVILRGDYLVESKPKAPTLQHNTFVCFVDISYNYLCVDRRRQCVGYAA